MSKKITVEIGVATNRQTWDTFDVRVTPGKNDDETTLAALKAAQKYIEKKGIDAAFYGIYHIGNPGEK